MPQMNTTGLSVGSVASFFSSSLIGMLTAPLTLPLAKFLCLAHNLLELFEVQLETEHHIRNEAGLLRREKRAAEYTAAAKEKGHVLSSLLTRLFQPLQRSIKLIRWLRSHWFSSDPLSRILPDLARSYAHS